LYKESAHPLVGSLGVPSL